jgi:hypothetical protein
MKTQTLSLVLFSMIACSEFATAQQLHHNGRHDAARASRAQEEANAITKTNGLRDILSDVKKYEDAESAHVSIKKGAARLSRNNINEIPVAASADAFKEEIQYAQADSFSALVGMSNSGDILMADRGSDVIVLDVGVVEIKGFYYPVAKIKIQGSLGYVPASWIYQQ